MTTTDIGDGDPGTTHRGGPRRPIRRMRIRGAAGGLAVTVVVLLAGCSSGSTSAPTTTAGSTAPASQTGSIAISNFTFIPAHLTVAPGARVTVVNRDQVAHTVTSATGGFNTGDIAPGASVTFTAPDHAGSFPYICSIHQYMTGTLTVS